MACSIIIKEGIRPGNLFSMLETVPQNACSLLTEEIWLL